MKCIDLTGEKLGRLTVIKRVENNIRGKAMWECGCECGNKKTISSKHLRSGGTRSCGCLVFENDSKTKLKHGQATTKGKTVEYRTWQSMINRCTKPNVKAFNHYGGRGITVCERWREFTNFFEDMGRNPSPKHSIERIDVNGNYEPSNCKWATHIDQARNKRISKRNNSGSQGVCWNSPKNKWQVYISVSYKNIYIGRFDILEDAVKARKEAEFKYWGKSS